MSADSQFQLLARYPGNLDRCRRCGIPRKMHGADGSCGLSLGSGLRTLLPVVTGALAALAGASWLLASNTDITASSAAAFASLVAIILLAASAAVVGRET
jgi:cytochrome bd-type quinol oxidase subunit 2